MTYDGIIDDYNSETTQGVSTMSGSASSLQNSWSHSTNTSQSSSNQISSLGTTSAINTKQDYADTATNYAQMQMTLLTTQYQINAAQADLVSQKKVCRLVLLVYHKIYLIHLFFLDRGYEKSS